MWWSYLYHCGMWIWGASYLDVIYIPYHRFKTYAFWNSCLYFLLPFCLFYILISLNSRFIFWLKGNKTKKKTRQKSNSMVLSSHLLLCRYYSTQKLSAKSDVFSFGVVLLEIISGREPLNIHRPRNEWSLVEWVQFQHPNSP